MIVLPIGILLLLITCIGLGILAAVLIKHGYGKALAIVFGGFALFIGIGIFALVGISPSVQPTSISATVSAPSAKVQAPMPNEFQDLSHLVATNTTITIGDDEIETKVTKDASDDLLALATKEGQEIEIGSESKSLKEAPEWVTGTTNTNKKVLVSEPYLGSAFLPDGKPNKAVERDLMNQLGEWLAHKYDLTLEKSVSNEGERLCVAGTSHQGLWEKCITETFVLKNETSVGDTETLYVLAEMDNKKAEWFYQLDYARRNQAAQSRTMLIVSGLGGGVFLGLASLYGILSYGGPSTKTETP